MIRKGMFIGDRYEILDKVGSGGMSDVYKAKCHKLNRFVAIKVLKQEFSEDRNFVSKFRVEAQSAAGLTHPNIVNVYDVGEDNGLYYIVMELIEGITLKKYIEKKGKLPTREAVSIAIQVAQGIEAAHNNHIIHRDIKPQNIIISREGKVKVTDFGIARAASSNTINSNAMGSVHYISPEQARGGFVDEKSDIYSLGITLYEMITGVVPFEGDSTVTIALQHIQSEIPSPKNFVPDLSLSVEKIIEKCTQKKADRRYLKVSSLIADLKHSLIAPDEDFVQLSPMNSDAKTIIISDDEVVLIRQESGLSNIDTDYDLVDEDDDDFEEFEEDEEDDDIDSVNPKLDKLIQVGGIVAAVIIVVIAILLFVTVFDGFKNCNGEKSDKGSETSATLDANHVYCPSVINMTLEEARDTLNKAGLGVNPQYGKSNYTDKDKVYKQSEEANSVVAKNSTITIWISLGGEEMSIPDVVGEKAAKAEEILSNNGYKVVTKTEDSETVETGNVIRTDPEPGSPAKYGDTITIYISSGQEKNKSALVPTLIGKTVEEADAALTALDLVLGDQKTRFSDSYPKGQIIEQDYDPDSKVPVNTKINVVVSLGPEIEETTKPTETERQTKKPKETTTKKPKETTTAPPETTTEPRVYSAKITLKKADFNFGDATSGNVTIAFDDNSVNFSAENNYTSVSDWSQNITINLTADSARSVTIYVMLDGNSIGSKTVDLR